MQVARLIPRLLVVLIFFAPGVPVFAEKLDCKPQKGRQVFARCRKCHSLTAQSPEELSKGDQDRQKEGPTLFGMFQRPAGKVQGFVYSDSMRLAEFYWEQENLDAFLRSPLTFMTDTTMAFRGIRNDKQRLNLYCYLQSVTQVE